MKKDKNEKAKKKAMLWLAIMGSLVSSEEMDAALDGDGKRLEEAILDHVKKMVEEQERSEEHGA